jgi:hypothetical protein
VVPLAVVQVPAEPVLALVVQAPEVVPLALELVVQAPEVVPLAVVQVPAEPVRALEVPAPEVARPAEPVLEVQALEVVPLAVVQVPAEPVRALEVQALEVLALEVPALEVPALEVVRLAEPVRVAQPLRAVVRVRVAEAQVAPVLALAAPRVAQQPRAPAEPERVARPVQERQAWQAAEVEPLRPPSAVAQRVPLSQEPSVEAPLAALAHRVRSVPLPALPASALRPAAGHPTGPRMAPPQGHPARTEALGAGHGAIFRRPILPRRSPAAISCVRYISGASSSRARRTA